MAQAAPRRGRTGRVASGGAAILVLLGAGCAVSAEVMAPLSDDASSAALVLEPSAGPVGTPTPTTAPSPTPTVGPIIPTALLWEVIDENFAALDDLDVEYSFSVSAAAGDPDGERDPALVLLPASNQKVVTAAGALELLDDDFRFQTELRVDADNNVYVVGGGDPTFRSRHVRAFAATLVEQLGVSAPATAAAGDLVDAPVTTVVGDVVVDPSYFPPTRAAPGWPARYIPADVGPMSGLWLDDNRHRSDDAYLQNPDLGNAQLIVNLLGKAGITVTGQARVGEVDPAARLVSTRRSPKLERLVDTLLGRSDNEIGEALLRQIALEGGGQGEVSEGKALVHGRLAALGVDLGEAVGDGSGLSRDNRLSALQLVEVLELARAEDWWPVVEDGLASAGTDGTLRGRLESDTTSGNVRAKTGTLDDARSLSGILHTLDGEQLMFGFVVNGEDAPLAVRSMDRIVVAYASATMEQLLR